MFNSLSGRFLILTIIFVMLAEVLIFVPSIARFRVDYLNLRLERAQIAALAKLAADMIDEDVELELLENAGVYNVALRRDEARQLVLSTEVPSLAAATFDLRETGSLMLIRDALARVFNPTDEVIRVIGAPVRAGGTMIEVTMGSASLRDEMLDYGLRILLLSAVISVLTAVLLFAAVRMLLVKPIKGVVQYMKRYASAPEDARGIIQPSAGVLELREAEEALQQLQTELTQALKQRERLAQLGGAVAKVNHDLRNILTSAQLFTDRIESSEDPIVRRLAPKLVNSISRAVSLCEGSLAFGRAEEPAPRLALVSLEDIVVDVVDSETLAVEGQDIRIVYDIPMGLIVRADGEQLYRVLQNLVRNAHQAIAATGKSGVVSVASREDDDNWWITIADTGPGLPPKAKEHLFTAFQGGARKGGSGLGLAIAAELIRGHGGTIALKHTGTEGTAFEICLPKGEDY